MARPIKITILGDASNLDRALGQARSGLGGLGRAAGIAGAAVGAGMVAAGVAAVRFAGEFDRAYDTIRVGTGATGEALEGLEDDFRSVVQEVPASFGDASQAIADLNTRLGLSGQPLQDMAAQVLELSRITGEDLGSVIESTTRVMGDWSVAAGDQGDAMDLLFRASQATGISVGDLSRQLVQYGAPMRQLGFTMEEGAAILGRFEREGVNAELVMGSMRQALGRMARDGEPAVETFQRVVGEIENAGSASEANALALELFGARAGPDMAAAIREGRFEVGELLGTIEGGSDTILGVGEETQSWGEKLTLLKNRVLVAIEPLLMRVFEALERFIDAIGPAFETLQSAVRAFQEGGLQGLVQFLEQKFGEDSNVVRVVRFLGTAFQETWTFIAEEVIPRVQQVMEDILAVIQVVTDVILFLWDHFGSTILSYIQGVMEAVWRVFEGAFQVIQGLWDTFKGLFTGDWGEMWDGIKRVFEGVWNALGGVVEAAWNSIRTAVRLVIDGVRALWDWSFLSDLVGSAVGSVVGFFTGLPGQILETVSSILAAARAVGTSIIDGIIEGVGRAAGLAADIGLAIARGIRNAIDRYVLGAIRTGLLGLARTLASVNIPGVGRAFDAASSAIEGFVEGFHLPRFAMGGTSSGGFALVGERGPEVVYLPQGSKVDPLHGGAAPGGGVTVNVQSQADPWAIAREVAWSIRTGGR